MSKALASALDVNVFMRFPLKVGGEAHDLLCVDFAVQRATDRLQSLKRRLSQNPAKKMTARFRGGRQSGGLNGDPLRLGGETRARPRSLKRETPKVMAKMHSGSAAETAYFFASAWLGWILVAVPFAAIRAGKAGAPTSCSRSAWLRAAVPNSTMQSDSPGCVRPRNAGPDVVMRRNGLLLHLMLLSHQALLSAAVVDGASGSDSVADR